MTAHERDQLAAEYVLGTLDAVERAEAARLIEHDAEFVTAVEQWELRLAPLAEAVGPVTPPRSLRQRLVDYIGDDDASPDDPTRQFDQSHRMSTGRRLADMRIAAVGLIALAAVALSVFYALREPVQPGAQYVAMLSDPALDEIGYEATIELEEQRLLIRSLGPQPPANKSYEVWLMYKDGRKSLTLGLVERDPSEMTKLPVKLKAGDLTGKVTLAISLEAMGGAPVGQSMGPLVFAGPVEQQ